MSAAGRLGERVAFDQRADTDDSYGNFETAFVEQFSRAAALIYLRGGETVIAARLAGTQPVVIRVRRDQETETVRADWRVRDVRAGTVFAIRSIVPSDDHAWLDFTCETGVAA
jgi:head-tail adaptor